MELQEWVFGREDERLARAKLPFGRFGGIEQGTLWRFDEVVPTG
jgi:hypothetical protein